MAKAKEAALPRIESKRQALIERLSELLAREDISQRSSTNFFAARNGLRDHLKPSDLSGALRDNLGMAVRKSGSGKTFNHMKEVKEGLKALEKGRQSLAYEVRARAMGGAVEVIFSETCDALIELAAAIERFPQVP